MKDVLDRCLIEVCMKTLFEVRCRLKVKGNLFS